MELYFSAHVRACLLAIMLLPSLSLADDRVSAPCLIEPSQQVAIGTPVTGVLDDVLVKRGAKITKGQTLATLLSHVEKAAVQLAKYKSEQTAAIDLATHKMAFAQRKFERRQAMTSDKLMPEQERDDAEADYRLAEAELHVAQENHQLALYEYQQQQAQLTQKTIRSPLNGVVVEQSSYVGEVVEPNSSSKSIVKLAQLDPLRVQVILPQAQFGHIKVGQKVNVSPDKPMTGRYQATVKTVDPILDAASGTFIVYLTLPNRQLQIPAGIRCQALF